MASFCSDPAVVHLPWSKLDQSIGLVLPRSWPIVSVSTSTGVWMR